MPLVLLVEESGPLSHLPPPALSALGAALAVYPGTVRYAAAWAAREALRVLRGRGTSEGGTSEDFRGWMLSPQEWDNLVGMDDAFELERRFPPTPAD